MSKPYNDDSHRGMPIAADTPPVVRWAWVGAGIMVFILYVFGTWFATGRAVPTNPGPDPLPEVTRLFIFWIQIVVTLISLGLIWYFVIAPWRRDGQMNTTGMLYLCWLSLFFQDPMMSYTSCTLFYNSYMVNLGTWTLGATPGWSSPNGSNLPVPLLLIIGVQPVIAYARLFVELAVLLDNLDL